MKYQSETPETDGEAFQAQVSFTFGENPGRIEKGEFMAPARIDTTEARRFAALHTIVDDLEFARDAFRSASEIGLPDVKDITSRSLIYAAVVAYSRPFKEGVRMKINPEYFSGISGSFDRELHSYIINVRDKHVSHSVNDLEYCETVALMVGIPGGSWRWGNAIGVTKTRNIGITKAILDDAVDQIDRMISHISNEISVIRAQLLEFSKEKFGAGGNWDIAPAAKFADRTQIHKPRGKKPPA